MSEQILRFAIESLTEFFDEFLSECMDENYKPKAPTMKALMKARGCIPVGYKTTLVKE